MNLTLLSSVVPPNTGHKKLRIAVLNRTFSTTGGGAEHYAVALVEQLSTRHDIHVFAQETDHQWPGITYHRISAPFRKPRWINQLWFATATWWATRRGFDIVHSHENTWHGNIQTVHVLPVKYNLFYGRKGWRLVVRWIKVLSSPRLMTYLALECWRYALQPGRQVVVTSESLLAVMNFCYPGSRKMLSVVTPGITLPQLPASPQRMSEARVRLGLPAAGFGLLFIANDYRKKGLPVLLEALAKLPADVFLVVVGNPAQIPLFQEQLNALGLDKRLFFLGSLKDVGIAYEAADCLVHPTLEDTFAMVVLEALAYGLPVVVSGSKYCGIAGLLKNRVNAVILDDPKNVFDLHCVLEQMLTQPALRNQLALSATDFASRYQWQEIALRQEVLYFVATATKRSLTA